jgi:hypothetical protein
VGLEVVVKESTPRAEWTIESSQVFVHDNGQIASGQQTQPNKKLFDIWNLSRSER